MSKKLEGRSVAILATDGFEQVELTSPREALEAEGALVEIVSPKREDEKLRGWKHGAWGDAIDVDVSVRDADVDDYDALVLPGGVMNADKLRVLPEVQRFVRSFFDDGKPVAAICHGPWTLIDSGVADGRRMTSWPSLRVDLENAGVDWVDEEVVRDGGLVTSRNPDDLPAFNDAMIELFAAGRAPTRGWHATRRHRPSP
jgi:protease I